MNEKMTIAKPRKQPKLQPKKSEVKNMRTYTTGTIPIFSGVGNDPNPDFNDFTPAINKNSQIRVDDQVYILLNCVKLPILNADWELEGGDDKLRDYLTQNFLGNKDYKIRTWLPNVLLKFDYGFAPFENVVTYDKESKLYFIAQHLIHPTSINTLETDNRGIPIALVQYDPVQGNLIDSRSATNKIDIANNIIFYTNKKEGDNPIGQSVCRFSFRPWYIKNQLLQIYVRQQNTVNGAVVAKVQNPDDEQTFENVRALASSLNTMNDSIGLIGIEESLNVLGNTNITSDIMEAISKMNRSIMALGLASFMNMADGGTYNLAEIMKEFYDEHSSIQLVNIVSEIQENYINEIARINNVEPPMLSATSRSKIWLDRALSISKEGLLDDKNLSKLKERMNRLLYT